MDKLKKAAKVILFTAAAQKSTEGLASKNEDREQIKKNFLHEE